MEKTTILIVEDEAIVAADLAAKLALLGYEIAGNASTGEAGFEMAGRFRPDLILMDIRLRGPMDGIEAAEKIRERFDIPVIYLTAHSDPPTLSRAKITGPFGYVLKPFEERDLSTSIEMGLHRHQSDRSLREQQEWLRVTLASIGDAVVTCDLDGYVTFLNPVAESVTGWTTEAAQSHRAEDVLYLVNEETREKPPHPVSLVLRDGLPKALANHTALVAKDGRVIPIEDSAAPILDREGRVIGVVLVFHDVTEKRRARDDLERSEKRFRQTFAQATIGFSMAAPDGRFLDANPAFCSLVGLTIDQLRALTIAQLVHPEDQKENVEQIDRMLSGQASSFVVENRYLRGDGESVWVRKSTSLVRDRDGEPSFIITLVEDITSRKRTEDALQRAHDELEIRVRERTAELQEAYESLQREVEERHRAEGLLRQAQKIEALGTLAGGIAHDFNNILAAIIGFSEIIVDRTTKESRENRLAERIHAAGLRGRELVKQMLTFSRRTEEERKPILLSNIITESMRLLRASIPSTIAIKTLVESESGLIVGDPVQIAQVVMNLTTNAAYAMREKGGTLTVTLSDATLSSSESGVNGLEPGPYLKLAVADTGSGIQPEVIHRVFDPFFTTKGVGEGTGLGLSVALGIVKQANGTISAESTPGAGSTFTVLIPMIPKEAGQGCTADEISPPPGNERILFVDDEIALVEMGGELLADLGYEVTCRTDSIEALSLVKEDPSRFDLVVTDQTMPEMAGLQLAKEILAVRPDMPILLCTGFSHTVNQDTAKAAGVKGFLFKPLTKREIARAIRTILDDGQPSP
jgi:PAS domain S-box-containing protein